MIFHNWLRKYVHKSDPVEDFDRLMGKLNYVRTGGKKFTREEMNER